MSTPQGNHFWEQANQAGETNPFQTPVALWQAACQYFQWCDQNPLYKPTKELGIRNYELGIKDTTPSSCTAERNETENTLNSQLSTLNSEGDVSTALDMTQAKKRSPRVTKQLTDSTTKQINNPQPTLRPYTLQGLCLYLNCTTQHLNQLEKGLTESLQDSAQTIGKQDEDSHAQAVFPHRGNGKGAWSDTFSAVITRIKDTIYNQKYTAAAAGLLNPTIIAKDLGLTTQTKTQPQTEPKKTEPDIEAPDQETTAELIKLRQKLQ